VLNKHLKIHMNWNLEFLIFKLKRMNWLTDYKPKFLIKKDLKNKIMKHQLKIINWMLS
jgi:hypothetical protein